MLVEVDLNSLADLGEPEFVAEMVGLFEEVSKATMADMRGAIDASLPASLVQAAHKLRGACLGMFATTAAELAEMLERAGRAAQLRSAPELLRILEQVIAETASRMRTVAAP